MINEINKEDLLSWLNARPKVNFANFAGRNGSGSLSFDIMGNASVEHNKKEIFYGNDIDEALNKYNELLNKRY